MVHFPIECPLLAETGWWLNDGDVQVIAGR